MVTINAVASPDRGNAYDPTCPTRQVLDRIGGRWTVPVVGALVDGPLRFTELREQVGGVVPKVLTQTLRVLERDGLITRTIYAEVAPRVEYDLTDLGRTLQVPIAAVREWPEANVPAIVGAREHYDRTTQSSPAP
jgi:DNA-binding HxlR family transcriptional regulator